MINAAPLARILVRYVVGVILGADVAGIIEADPELMTLIAAGVGIATEAAYALAVRRGWAT